MSRLPWLPFRSLLIALSLGLLACGGSGESDPGGGGTGGTVVPFCVTDDDCAGGAASDCQAATCDIEAGVCVNNPLPDGTACNDAAGVCRDGFCAATELKAFLKAPRPEPNALFGTSVSIVGNRMLVGSPSSGPPFGTVALFERSEDQWSTVQEIDTPPAGQSCGDGLFGWSVATAAEQENLFVVGSMGFGLGGIGSVRVFIKRPGVESWTQESAGVQRGCLRGLDTTPLDLFAESLALTPDGQTLVVGAPGHSSGEQPIAVADRDYSGAVYIFEKINSVDWSQPGPTKAANAGGSYECIACEEFACPTSGEGDGFGAAVAVSDDTIVVGAPAEGSAATGVNGDDSDDSAPGAGAAYVFEKIDDEWVQTAYLKASNTDAGDRFGFAVAISGDTIVVGAEREDSDQGDNQGVNAGTSETNGLDCEAGAAYVFERSGGVWEQTQYLKASNVDCGYFFGAMVSVTDTTLVVGSPGESSVGGENSGAAYVFTLDQGEWAQSNFYKAFNADPDSAFAGPPGSVAYGIPSSLVSCEVQATTKGSSMGLSGDTLVVGTPYEDSPAIGANGTPSGAPISNSGAVYIFDNSEGQ